ncbi:MAG TPA: hypothetical protein VNU71_13300 [Burkholderiaceae bacterium]|nr:hypothetical protein [Burkholderiaceae bacterium]
MQARTFSQTVEALRFGTLSDELTKQLRDLVAKCSESGRSGALTLTLQLKPGKGGQIEVFDDLKVKLPKEERGSSLMFATVDNNLQREDPRQLQLEGLRTVDTGTGELRIAKQGA